MTTEQINCDPNEEEEMDDTPDWEELQMGALEELMEEEAKRSGNESFITDPNYRPSIPKWFLRSLDVT